MKARLNHLLVLVSRSLGILVLQACKKDTVEVATLETPLLEQAKTYFETQVLAEKAKEQFPSVSKVSPWMRQSLINRPYGKKPTQRKYLQVTL